jgi:hypothetical protein
MSSVWMIRPGLVTGAIFSLGACLLWLLIEQDLSAGALLRSAAWGFIAWPVYVMLWVAVCHGEEFENSRALASAEGAAGTAPLYRAAARSCARGDIGCRVPGPGYRRGRPGYFQLKGWSHREEPLAYRAGPMRFLAEHPHALRLCGSGRTRHAEPSRPPSTSTVVGSISPRLFTQFPD